MSGKENSQETQSNNNAGKPEKNTRTVCCKGHCKIVKHLHEHEGQGSEDTRRSEVCTFTLEGNECCQLKGIATYNMECSPGSDACECQKREGKKKLPK